MTCNTRRRLRGKLATTAVSAILICLSACGNSVQSLDSAKIERAIAEAILQEHKLAVKVACPPNVPQQRGRVFTCSALLDVGAYPVTVTETDGTGRVRYQDQRPLVVLNVAKVRRSIAASILRQRHVTARAFCPPEVLQQAGLVFRCTAVIDASGRHYPFVVSELDSSGAVRYVGT